MPTRISLTVKNTPPTETLGSRLPRTSPLFLPVASVRDEELAEEEEIPPPSPLRNRRSQSSFRSSFLRDFTAKDREEEAVFERLSTDDIRASPRILGYFLCMITGAVMLASILQFYREPSLSSPVLDDSKFFASSSSIVYRWKLWWSIYLAATGTGLSLLIVLAHFDTVFLPKVWKGWFKDGSTAERNLIFFLIVFWAATAYICTSPLSVGESQANTFFTSWIALASIFLNYGVWRESAGLSALSERFSMNNRETSYNWLWTGFFSTVFAGASTDIFVHRDEITLRLKNEVLLLDKADWIVVLCVVWSEVGVCALAVLLNELFSGPWKLYRFRKRTCVFGWPQIEGPIILLTIGAKLWVIIEYTGVNGVVNGLSNAYFGIWGSFFNSVFCLGTWIRENKDIDYFIKAGTSAASVDHNNHQEATSAPSR